MNLDPATEMRLLPWLSSALALVMVVLFAWMSTRYPRARALRSWAGAFLCVSAANAGFAMRGMAPDFATIIMANLLLQASFVFTYAGAQHLNSIQPRRVDIFGWVLIAVFCALMLWFTYQVPDLRVRIVIVCLSTMLLSSRIALQLSAFAMRRGSSTPASILAGLWWLLIFILLVTAAATWVFGVDTQSMYQSNPAVHILFQVRPVLALFISVFCLWTQLLALKMERADYFARIGEGVAANRTAFDQRCNEALASPDAQPLSVALIDLDNFQAIAKLHGYAAADAVVGWVGETARHQLRPGDSMNYYSHDQYALLLPATGKADARLVLDDIRRRIERGHCLHEGLMLTTTVSAGLAVSQPDRNTVRAMIAAARVAMIQARGEGRNRVVVAHDISADTSPSGIRR